MTEATSVVQFIAQILDRGPMGSRVAAHRGHESAAFVLQPSVFRSSAAQENEHILLRELIAAHPAEFSADSSALEQLVRMQHYSLPTRLLDVSWNPLVALYFACQSHKEPLPVVLKSGRRVRRPTEVDGEVVTLSVPRTRIRYYDSDKVSLIANLARLKDSLKAKIDTKLAKVVFNNELPIKRLLHFVRQEKFQFEAEVKPRDLDDIVLVKPKQNNRRILAQDGAFFIFGQTKEIAAKNEHFIRIERIKIPAGSKGDILAELDRLAINEKTLFPEIDRAARYFTANMSSSAMLSKIL